MMILRNIFQAMMIVAVWAIITPSTALANVQNFRFSSFEADYYLSRDSENRSALRVREVFVAQFPDFDQNHGIERAIPAEYDNHPVSIAIKGVTNSDGESWEYTTYKQSDHVVLRIGDANTFVRGKQTYIIEYTLRDLTKSFETGDEFYWDTNGTMWQQSFDTVSTRVHIDQSLASALDGRTACYTGRQGSTASDCSIAEQTQDGSTAIVATSNSRLNPHENLTIVVGFAPETFAPYQNPPMTLAMKLFWFVVVPVLYVALPIWLLIWGVRKWRAQGRDQAEQRTIIAQYSPPKRLSVAQSDVIINTKMRTVAITATIIDLAVRHFIRIYEIKKNEYEIELLKSTSGLDEDEKAIVDMIFGNEKRVALNKRSDYYSKSIPLAKNAYTLAIQRGHLVDTRSAQRKMYIVGGAVLVLAILTINPLLVVACVVTLVAAQYMPARTHRGVEFKEYLDGVKLYMEVAEAERIRVLQSPDTAEKIDTNDNAQIVKLYERLLPLAMLYGIEEKWAKQFANLYTPETQPDWFVGNYSAFTTGAFVGALHNFGMQSAMTLTPPSSSSGSGFSGGGGGGFSGGGGGGGGGGGW